MKSIATLLLAFIFAMGAFSQDEGRLTKSEIRKLQREQRKQEQEAEKEQMVLLTRIMVEQHRFVLEADFLSDRIGTRVPVQSNINFIMIDSLEGVVQFGSAMSIGYNGVGGATIEGRITKYEYNMIGKNKDGYSLTIVFISTLGSYDITMMINADGYADATIRGNWSGALSYHGKLVPLKASKVYKGYSRF